MLFASIEAARYVYDVTERLVPLRMNSLGLETMQVSQNRQVKW